MNKLFYFFGKSGVLLESSSGMIFLLCYWEKVGYVMRQLHLLQTEVLMKETFSCTCRTGLINPALLLINFETIPLNAMGMHCSLLALWTFWNVDL